MKKLRRFKCGACHREYERLVEDDIKSIKCECKAKAARMLAAPKFTNNSVGKNASF